MSLLNLCLSTIFCGLAAAVQGYSFNFNITLIFPLFYLGAVILGLRFFFITYGQSKIKASHAGLIYLCEPITAALIGCFILEEKFTHLQLAGIVILITTVIGSVSVIGQEEGKLTIQVTAPD